MLEHRLRSRILRILKFPKIHNFFTNFKTVNFKIHKIQVMTFIAAKLQQTLRPKGSTSLLDRKFCDVNSLTQQFSMITSSLTKSTNRLQLHCLPQCRNRSPKLPTVPIQQLPQCKSIRLQRNCS